MSNPTTTMPVGATPSVPAPGATPAAPTATALGVGVPAPAAPTPAPGKPAKAPKAPRKPKAPKAPTPAPFAMPAYAPRVRQPTMVLAMGPVQAKPGTIRGWLQSQLAAVLKANGSKTCTVQAWVDQVVANRHLCNTRCKPAKLSAWDSFCNGYLRRHMREQEVLDGAALVAKPSKPSKAPAKP